MEIRAASSIPEEAIKGLFRDLVASHTTDYFRPHEFDDAMATWLAHYAGRDLYFVLTVEGIPRGYAMLRGWDEGYETPSLGIALVPSIRGKGLGRMFMQFLHTAARLRGATQVRLTVDCPNSTAIELYRSMGYDFQPFHEGRVVGYLQL